MRVEGKKKILLVEDDFMIALSQKKSLEKCGYDIITVTTGEDAIETCKNTQGIHLILMDIDLGQGIDGTEAAERILKNHDIPIVFCSNHTEKEVVEKTEKITSYGYVVKDSGNIILDTSIKMALKLFESKQKYLEKQQELEISNDNLRKTNEHLEILQKELILSENKFRKSLEYSPIPIAVAKSDGELIFLNNQFINTYGYTVSDIKSMENWFLLAYPDKEYLKFVINDWQSKVNHAIENHEATSVGEYRVTCKNGEVKTVEISAYFENELSIGLIRDITEQKLVEEAMVRSEERLKMVAENFPDGIIVLYDSGYKYIYAEGLGLAEIGLSKEMLLGKKPRDLFPARFCEILESKIEGAFKGKKETFEIELEDGFFLQTVLPIKNTSDEIIAVLGVINNITERKRIELELQKKEDFLRTIYNSSGSALFVVRVEGKGKYIYEGANTTYENLFGIKSADIEGKTPYELIPIYGKDTINYVMELYDTCVTSGEVQESEIEIITPGGVKSWWLSKLSPLFDKNGEIYLLIGTSIDITYRKKAEMALLKSEQELKKAQEITQSGSFYIDLETGQVSWTEGLYKMYGFDPEFSPPLLNDSQKLFAPESWELLSTSMEKTSKDGIPYEIELKTIKEDGSNGWMWARGEAIHDNDNKIIALCGVVQDITGRKKIEEELIKTKEKAESNEGFINALLQSIDDVVVARNEKNEVEYFNKSFDEITQKLFQIHAYKGLNTTRLLPDEARKYWEDVLQYVLKGNKHREEFQWVYPDNNIRYYEIFHFPIYMHNKSIGTIEINRDITVRKQSEASLKESESVFRKLFEDSSDAILLIDSAGVFVECNQAALNLLKMKREEFIMLPPSKISPEFQPDGRLSSESAQEMIALAYSKGLHRFDWTCINSEGGEFIVEVSLMPVVIKGQTMLHTTWRNITERKKNEEKIKSLLAEKETLLKEVHHRIKNNIASIESFLFLQAEESDNPGIKAALQDALTRIQSMRVLYEKLLLGKDYREVSVKKYMESLIDSIGAVFPESKKVIIEKQITDLNLTTKIMIPVGIILNELLTNVFKYAFKDKNSGHIKISLEKFEKQVTLTIQDNGKGIDDRNDLNKSEGFGLMIVRMLTQQLSGAYTIENNNGARSILKFEV